MRNMDYIGWSNASKCQSVLYGVLTPADWNREEVPVEFSLFTPGEEDIFIDAPHLKKKMMKLAGKPVEVIGDVKKDEFGDRILKARKIRRLNYPEYQFMVARIKKPQEEEVFLPPGLMGRLPGLPGETECPVPL